MCRTGYFACGFQHSLCRAGYSARGIPHVEFAEGIPHAVFRMSALRLRYYALGYFTRGNSHTVFARGILLGARCIWFSVARRAWRESHGIAEVVFRTRYSRTRYSAQASPHWVLRTKREH